MAGAGKVTLMLNAEERSEYERLMAANGSVFGDSRVLAAKARVNVAERRAQKKTQTLRELAVSSFDLSYVDQFTLYGAFRVIQKKGLPVLNRMIGNWQTTATATIVAFGVYLQGPGMHFPATAQEWKVAALAVAIQVFGLASKDATTGSEPGATR